MLSEAWQRPAVEFTTDLQIRSPNWPYDRGQTVGFHGPEGPAERRAGARTTRTQFPLSRRVMRPITFSLCSQLDVEGRQYFKHGAELGVSIGA